jgi:hypothetical protein
MAKSQQYRDVVVTFGVGRRPEKKVASFKGNLNTPLRAIDHEVMLTAQWILVPAELRQEDPGRVLPLDLELRRQKADRDKRMQLLFEHYEIPAGQWERLAKALAGDFVPGLRIASAPPGKKIMWDRLRCSALRADLDQIREQRPGLSLTDAARIAAKKEPWRSMVSGSKAVENLRRRAYNATAEFTEFFRKFQRDRMRRQPQQQKAATDPKQLEQISGASAVRRYVERWSAQEDWGPY